MSTKFKIKDFDEVVFINNGKETPELINAKEYLKDIQMTINIGDVFESLFQINDLNTITNKEQKELFEILKESIFSMHSLSFLEKVKLITSFEGINTKLLEEAQFDAKDNYIYLNQNLINHCSEFVTAVWDMILLIKMSHAKGETSVLVEEFNNYFAELTKIKTGNANAYIKKESALDMICELALFMQYYLPDFFIFLIKSKSDISTAKNLKQSNKLFVDTLKKSKKIGHRLQMLQQIKSNNYQYLLKLLIEQKNSEIK